MDIKYWFAASGESKHLLNDNINDMVLQSDSVANTVHHSHYHKWHYAKNKCKSINKSAYKCRDTIVAKYCQINVALF